MSTAFIQWKGTDACLDLHCTCGTDLHFDGDFAYAIRCWKCRAIWEMPTELAVTQVDYADICQDTEPTR